jgi:hypothetical protein
MTQASDHLKETIINALMAKALNKDSGPVPDDFPDQYKDGIESIRTADTKYEMYVLIDESDMSEWVAFGLGIRFDQTDKNYIDMQRQMISGAKRTVEKDTGLVVTDRIITFNAGDPIQYTRRMKRPNVSKMEALMGAPIYNYLAKVG